MRDWTIAVDASGDRGDAVLDDARYLRDQADVDGAATGMLMMGDRVGELDPPVLPGPTIAALLAVVPRMWARVVRGTIDV